ncbi:MAG: hypothetical protein K9W46_10415 [Candidatus Heimdallarchaeum endolithica]|uniref:Translation elongation factor EFTu-like domain-containing protein n=1 Tax=Candidatus Heimdallarchaeum endolithica TaxID=2876572 RepID=A0A9Y1BR11_9ARCH|nr:MAG: hypothetical protein K9W46_10415 [Candidatus Heimdallarchaeum endolithica]
MTETVCAYLLGGEPYTRQELAKRLGKKGTSSDICLYNYSKEFTLQIVDPIRYPDKPLTLFETIFMADVPIVIIPPEGPDIHTGEFLLLLSALGYKNGVFVIVSENQYVDIVNVEKKVHKITKGLIVEQYPFLHVDIAKGETIQELRSLIKEKAIQIPDYKWADETHSRVDVDHVFPVTGIGTVILGRVRSGEIEKGDQIHVFPSNRTSVIRSIQINDVDVKKAINGDRVGLALRGLLPKDVERGYVLSKNVSWNISKDIEVSLELTPYSKLPEVGKTRHIISGLQAISSKVKRCEKESNDSENVYELTLELEKPIVYFHTEPGILVDLNSRPKIIGKCSFKIK